MRGFAVLAVCLLSAGYGIAAAFGAESADEWKGRAQARIESQLKTPPGALSDLKEPRRAVVRFEVDRDGKVIEPTIEKSAGIEALDQAAIEAVKSASPLATPPLDEGATTTRLSIPFKFSPGFESAEAREWKERVSARIASNVKKPMAAMMGLKEPHRAIIRFGVDREGKVIEPAIQTSAGISALDRAALEAVKSVDPLSRPPVSKDVTVLRFVIPIRFSPISVSKEEATKRERAEAAKPQRRIPTICTGC